MLLPALSLVSSLSLGDICYYHLTDISCLLYIIFIGFTFSFVVGDNFWMSFTILLVPFSSQSKLDFFNFF